MKDRSITSKEGRNLFPYISKAGWIYIVEDDLNLNYIKVGYTVDLFRRINSYNVVRPKNTCKYTYISKLFENAFMVEQEIHRKILNSTSRTTLRKEWYLSKDKDEILSIIKRAENHFALSSISVF